MKTLSKNILINFSIVNLISVFAVFVVHDIIFGIVGPSELGGLMTIYNGGILLFIFFFASNDPLFLSGFTEYLIVTFLINYLIVSVYCNFLKERGLTYLISSFFGVMLSVVGFSYFMYIASVL